MDEDGGPSRPNGEKKDGKQTVKSSGDRCMVMNCGTTFQTGTVHRLPGKMPSVQGRFTRLQKAWINFIQLHRVFDPRQVTHLYLNVIYNKNLVRINILRAPFLLFIRPLNQLTILFFSLINCLVS